MLFELHLIFNYVLCNPFTENLLDTKLLVRAPLVVALMLIGEPYYFCPGFSVWAITIKSHWKRLDKQVIGCHFFLHLGQ